MIRRPLEDEDLLEEILLRLPPSPSSLPRASVVCKRWRGIVSDPEFLRRFRKHHRKPPLLGLFGPESSPGASAFSPALDPPDRIPPKRFAVPRSSSIGPDNDDRWDVLGCRHGLAVLANVPRRVITVWDPLTGRQRRVAFPPGLGSVPWVIYRQAAVLCADAGEGHVHGDCFSSPIKLVLVWVVVISRQACACVYESATGVWGDIVSTKITPQFFDIKPAILVGDALCWCLSGGDALTFGLETQSLGVIKKPILSPLTDLRYGMIQLFRTEDGGLGFAHLLAHTMKLWVLGSNRDGISRWVLLQTFQLEELFPQGTFSDSEWARMTGYDEDTNAIILSTVIGDFTFQVDTGEINHIIKRNGRRCHAYYPYRNFYTAGRAVGLKRLDLKVRTPEI
ncbi:hypothetical protein VPH35_102105 [Triticum aestivum]